MGRAVYGITYALSDGAIIFNSIPDSFRIIGTGRIGGIPYLTFVMVFFLILFQFFPLYFLWRILFGAKKEPPKKTPEKNLSKKARKNIPNNDVVDELVENYRKSLLVHAYQQNLVEQKLAENIPDEEVKAYYEANRDLFVAGQPLMKGIFIKVPLNAAEVGKVRRCYTKNSSEDVEFLEKYSFQHAVDYNYFYDRWLPLHDVVAKLPLSVSDAEARLKQEGHIELKDSANYYFLNVDSFLPAGEVEPYEYAYKTAKEMLVNLKRISFIGEVKSSLYNEALKEKRIIYY